MELHAHPLEFLWFALVLIALLGCVRSALLRMDARDLARVDLLLKSEGSLERLYVARANIWFEVFRLTVVAIDLSVAITALFSLPEDLIDFTVFPQTLFNLTTGIVRAIVFALWALFDIHARYRGNVRTRKEDHQ